MGSPAKTKSYRVRFTKTGKETLRRIGKKYGKKTYEILKNLIAELEFDPKKRGEALSGHLHGLYSRHYSRFRIIYLVNEDTIEVIVVATGYHRSGERSDIYAFVQRLVKSGHLKIDDLEPD